MIDIQSKYNKLRYTNERTALLSFLKKNYNYFGSNLRLFGILTDKDIEELKKVFESYGVHCKLLGEILQCHMDFIGEDKKIKRIEFFCILNVDKSYLQVFTFAPASELSYIDKIIRDSHGLYYLWISPKTLDHIKNEVIGSYEETRITFFTAKRFDNMNERCEIRPGFRRSFRYGGDDGRETLQELKQNYGVLPRTIHFKIPMVSEFRVNYRGLFTFQHGDLDYMLSLFEYALDEILKTKKIIESSVYQRITQKRKYREINFEKIIPMSIKLSSPLNPESCNKLINLVNGSSEFFSITEAIIEGSLYFSSTLIDRDKNESFIINSNGPEINVVKDSSTSFASILKFYQFIVERFDVDASVAILD